MWELEIKTKSVPFGIAIIQNKKVAKNYLLITKICYNVIEHYKCIEHLCSKHLNNLRRWSVCSANA